MPVIRVFAGSDGAAAAAAVMGAMAVKLSQPVAAPDSSLASRPEKAQTKNPHQLTRDQHVFPHRTMLRFADAKGGVDLHDLVRNTVRRTSARDVTFCARRAWDQRAEAGYMRETEKAFQSFAATIVDGGVATVATDQVATVTRMYALWYIRSRYRAIEAQEIKLNGLKGHSLTKAEEEQLEKESRAFIRDGGLIPARQLNGLEIEQRMNAFHEQLSYIDRWGVIRPQSGEFIVPDVSNRTIIPISPVIALVAGAPDGQISEGNLADINSAVRQDSVAYFFARDISACPF